MRELILTQDFKKELPDIYNKKSSRPTIPGRMTETKAFGQKMFELYYPELDFLAIFGKNYKQEEK